VHHIAVGALDDLDDALGPEGAGVERLAARCRIERGPIETNGRAGVVAADGHDRGVEVANARVVIVQPIGHRA
jgi:hypothetical protein